MDFSSIGSVSQYARGMALKTQWNVKKDSGDVTAHSKGWQDFLSVHGVSLRTEEDKDSEKLQAIGSKVNAGVKLTEREMEFLKEKNPQLYQKLRQIEREQREYEEALRRCKSKNQVERLHIARVSRSMEASKEGADPTAAYRVSRFTESKLAFMETDEYKKLPRESAEEETEEPPRRRIEAKA